MVTCGGDSEARGVVLPEDGRGGKGGEYSPTGVRTRRPREEFRD